MPTILIDENSQEILKNTKAIMKIMGQNASYSDAIRNLAITTVNLCRNCAQDFAECNGSPKFGNGTGSDNVYDCDRFILSSKQRW